jgi:hypothetical protein
MRVGQAPLDARTSTMEDIAMTIRRDFLQIMLGGTAMRLLGIRA